MSSRTEKDKTKQLQDKCQTVLTELLRDEDNKYCVDCDSKGELYFGIFYSIYCIISCVAYPSNYTMRYES